MFYLYDRAAYEKRSSLTNQLPTVQYLTNLSQSLPHPGIKFIMTTPDVHLIIIIIIIIIIIVLTSIFFLD